MRVLSTVLFLLGLACPAQAQWAVASSNTTTGAGAATTISTTVTVSTGQFIFVCVGSLSTTNITSIKLNTTAETLDLYGPNTDTMETFFNGVSLSSTQSGSVTVDSTFASSTSNRYQAVFVMSHSPGVVTLDSGNLNAQVDAAMTSSTFTATGSDLAVFGCGLTTTTINSELIGGAAATNVLEPASLFNLWWKAVSAGTTSASATLSGSAFWVADAISFNVTAASSGPRVGSTAAQGAGR